MPKKLRLVSIVLVTVIMSHFLLTIALAEEELTFGFSPETFIARLEEATDLLDIRFKGTITEDESELSISVDTGIEINVFLTENEAISLVSLMFVVSDEELSEKILAYLGAFIYAIENPPNISDCGEIISSLVENEKYDGSVAKYGIVNSSGVMIVLANAKAKPITTKEPSPESTIEPLSTYNKLAKGSKGDAVKELQERLIELKYLAGNADGAYGEKTALAVTTFQKVTGITPTGIADPDTQARLFSVNAEDNPERQLDQSSYDKMNYKAIARDPSAYKDKKISFTGKVIQVVENEAEILGITISQTTYRIATKGSYDDIVLVIYSRPSGASRILDDDRVTVYGTCDGVTSYKSTMGGTITIPSCIADRIELR